jgi:hypothetical protein
MKYPELITGLPLKCLSKQCSFEYDVMCQQYSTSVHSIKSTEPHKFYVIILSVSQPEAHDCTFFGSYDSVSVNYCFTTSGHLVSL